MSDGILIRPDRGEVLWWFEGQGGVMASLTSVDSFLSQFRCLMGRGFRISRRRAYLGCVHETGAYLKVVTAPDEDEGGAA